MTVSASAFVKILYIIICIPKVFIVEDYIFDFGNCTPIFSIINNLFYRQTVKRMNEPMNELI